MPGILELAALGDRDEVEARTRELDAEPRRILDMTAAFDDVVAEIPAADDAAPGYPGLDRRDDLERQPHPLFARPRSRLYAC